MSESEPITIGVEREDLPSKMKVNPVGARIERLELDGILLLNAVARGDGRQASTHPCTPVFGPETITAFGLSQHGPMRNENCGVLEQSPNRLVLAYDIQAGTYPPGMRVTQRFTIPGRALFTLETTHENTGEAPAPVNFGEHFYWISRDGWKGLKINGQDVTELVETDGVFQWKERNKILIPGYPEIILDQHGLPWVNLWVYKDDTTGEYDQRYVCIEPVEGNPQADYFGSPESFIPPGQSRATSISIRI